MPLTPRQYAHVLVNFLEKNPLSEATVSEATAGAFLAILRKNRQERLLGRILMIASTIWKEHRHELDVITTSPYPLLPRELESLKKSLEEHLHKKISVIQREDPCVKGGIALQAGDLLYDGTIRGRLERLRRALS